jgi:hypothetical protein
MPFDCYCSLAALKSVQRFDLWLSKKRPFVMPCCTYFETKWGAPIDPQLSLNLAAITRSASAPPPYDVLLGI